MKNKTEEFDRLYNHLVTIQRAVDWLRLDFKRLDEQLELVEEALRGEMP